MDAAEFGENTRKYITDYIKFADTKASAILAAAGIISAASGLELQRYIALLYTAHHLIECAAYLLGAIVCVSAVMTIWFGIAALSPSTPSVAPSLASFPDISELSVTEYGERAASLVSESIAKEYAIANASMARVATQKFTFISKSVWWLRILLFGSFGLGLLHLIRTIITRS